jgi:hypothetical protein
LGEEHLPEEWVTNLMKGEEINNLLHQIA